MRSNVDRYRRASISEIPNIPRSRAARLDEVTQGIALEDVNESVAGLLQCPPQNTTLTDCAGSIDRFEA